jgi:hypothetical protein
MYVENFFAKNICSNFIINAHIAELNLLESTNKLKYKKLQIINVYKESINYHKILDSNVKFQNVTMKII